MSFEPPTLAEIRDRAASVLTEALPGADTASRRSVEAALVRVVAGAAAEAHHHIAWAGRQITVPTCDDAGLLTRHATLWGIARRAAGWAAGTITVTGAAGAVLPAATECQRPDGRRYIVEQDIPVGDGGSGSGPVTALVAGAAGCAVAGLILTPLSPVAGIARVTVTGDGLTGGADIESVEALRARLLARIQAPPHGGAQADYLAWALAVPGITRAWVLPRYLGAGTVGVFVVADDAAGGPVPGAALVETVQAALDEARPVTADVTVMAPVAVPLPLTLAISPDTVAVRDAITLACADHLRREGAPGGAVYLSRLRAEISAAAGEARHVLVSPAADVSHAAGRIPVPGPITWTVYP